MQQGLFAHSTTPEKNEGLLVDIFKEYLPPPQ